MYAELLTSFYPVGSDDTDWIEFYFNIQVFLQKHLHTIFWEWTLLLWHCAELWRGQRVTEWVHNGSECFILTYWQLFSWKASPRESDPTERNCPAGGTSWDTVNGPWERELKLVQHEDVWMEYQICGIDHWHLKQEQWHCSLFKELGINCKGADYCGHLTYFKHLSYFL